MLIIRDDDYIWLNLLSDFIEDFVAPPNRARLYYLLSKPKRRREVVGALCRESHLDEQYMHPVPKCEQGVSEIYAKLRKLGAPTRCFVFDVRDEYGNEIKESTDLKDALEACVGLCGGTILYCPKEKLGYWEAHHCDRYILSKAPETLLPHRS